MPRSKILISHERLKALIHYDPETGIFTSLTLRQQVKIGQVLGSVVSNGHLQFMLDHKVYLAHVLAWFYMTGFWPSRLVDHKDRNGGNNRWNNLRLATFSENAQNSKLSAANTSGHKGVTWYKRYQKWMVQIGVNMKKIHLGYFASLDEAIAVRKAAEIEYFGEFMPN